MTQIFEMNNNELTILIERVERLFEQGNYRQAKFHAKKINNKQRQLLKTNSYSKLLRIEMVSLIREEKVDRAEQYFAQYKEFLNKEDKLELVSMFSTIYAVNDDTANYNKALFYLEQSVDIDSTIVNRQAVCLLYQLSLMRFDIKRAEKLWIKISKWEGVFEHYAIKRLETAFRLNLKAIADDTLDFLLRNVQVITNSTYRSLIYFLIASGRRQDALKLLNLERSKFTGSPEAQFLYAQYYFDERNYEQARKLLRQINQHFDASYQLLAQCEDKLGNFDEAFSLFTQSANLVFKHKMPAKIENFLTGYQQGDLKKISTNVHQSLAKKGIDKLGQIDINGSKCQLCFMVGFPRSGTTLLDNILDSQTSIISLSELDTVDPLIQRYENLTGRSYPIGVANLTLKQKEELKELYVSIVSNVIESVANYADVDKDKSSLYETQILIDKMPLNSIHLPLIYSLFPQAKFIFSLRQPLDVVMSNFQQFYHMNQEMSFLVRLEDCVERYVNVMRHALSSIDILKLDVCFVKYEDLISDIQTTMHHVFSYLDIVYDDEYLTFKDKSKNKLIYTPSRGQVKEKLYQSSNKKWKNYQQYLEPYIAQLQPLTHLLGYE